MVNIEINGISVEALDGCTVIEAADEAGITIPRFCYHKKLSIAANCRMCLVEVEKVGKPVPACATPVTEGMKIFTRSPKALSAQKSVMEFLLINHPLDCPICDQGGECDLQEMAMGFGQDVSRYSEGKRVVPDPDLGPLISTDMTRCIHCTRCVRFGQEIAGLMELGAPGRGEHMRIGTFVERSVDSELSGNVIDLCPVGALTSKPYRYTARPWELTTAAAVSPHDCVGANLKVETRGGRVMRVVPRENEAVNEVWLADRDRFSYPALYHGDRLTAPRIKQNGSWREVDWDTALTFAAEGLRKVVDGHGPERLAGLAGYGATCEELYLLQKLLRSLGCGNVDHRLRQQDFSDQEQLPAFPGIGLPLSQLSELDAALVVGSNLRKEQPLLAHRLRQAALKGGSVGFINPSAYDFTFPVADNLAVTPAELPAQLAAVAKALLAAAGETSPEGFDAAYGAVEPEASHKRLGEALKSGENAWIGLGALALAHPQAAELRALGALIARLSGARFGVVAEGGNAVGAALAGALPHRSSGGKPAQVTGRDWLGMLDGSIRGFLLHQLEPELDALDGEALRAALEGAEFTVALTAYASDAMAGYADVLLPVGLFAETSGTFVNAEGCWQAFAAAAKAPGDARPAWKVLRVLGNLLDVAGFDYMSSEEVLTRLRENFETASAQAPAEGGAWVRPRAPLTVDGLQRIAEYPIYAVDAMVRRAAPLQATNDMRAAQTVTVNRATAERAGVLAAENVCARQGEREVCLPLNIDERIPDGCVLLSAGVPEGLAGGLGIAAVELRGA